MHVSNRSKSPLGLPGNPVLDPGQTAFIHDWETISKNRIVSAWLHRGMLVVENAETTTLSIEKSIEDAAIADKAQAAISEMNMVVRAPSTVEAVDEVDQIIEKTGGSWRQERPPKQVGITPKSIG